jgi:hypothetical protein
LTRWGEAALVHHVNAGVVEREAGAPLVAADHMTASPIAPAATTAPSSANVGSRVGPSSSLPLRPEIALAVAHVPE